MKIAGFSFIKNAVINDYPIVEAINSILPICDEFVIAVGASDDETLQLIKNIASPKIRIIETVWDHALKEGGEIFAEQTNIAYHAISEDTDWAFYIQGDECVHEKYLHIITQEMELTQNDPKIEGLLLKYKHFYGSYDFTAESRRWYRREIRIVKRLPGLRSYKDAQGFRIANRKLDVKLIDAYIYHYGWVKPPQGISHKMNNFVKYYRENEYIEDFAPTPETFDYGNADHLVHFRETHPAVMLPRVEKSNWKFSFDPTKLEINRKLKLRILLWIEKKTGVRLFEYRNYKIVK
jgi:hypothetical protein